MKGKMSPEQKLKAEKQKEVRGLRKKTEDKQLKLLRELKEKEKLERTSSQADLPYTGNYSFV